MIVRFDSLNRFEKPKIFVCSPGCTYSQSSGLLSNVAGILSNTQDEELVARFNEESELNLRVPYLPPDNNEEAIAYKRLYKSLKNRRLLFLEDVGFFVITEVKDGFDGVSHYKDIEAHSCEAEIENKSVPFIEDGTYEFSDLFERIIGQVPLWTIGHVDSAIEEKYRTFEDVDTDLTCLGFLQENMQDAYECIFVYDIVNRQVNVYAQDNYVRDTSIHITEDDLIQSMDIVENSDNLYTAITVQGDEELNISPVNPIGTNTIYNFDYYIDWMSSGLAQKVRTWQNLVKSKEDDYYDLNLSYYTALENKSNITAEIDAINTQLTMYRRCRDNIVAEDGSPEVREHSSTADTVSLVRGYNTIIENSGGIPMEIYNGIGETLDGIEALIADAETALAEQEAALETVDENIASLQAQINAIHSQVDIATYFTASELSELDNYIFEGQYTDEYIAVTDVMGYEEKFAQMKTLYDRAVTQLERISQPTQEYSISSENFLFVKDFEPWAEQIETGCLINVELEQDDVAMLFLIELTVNYDDESLSMTFGNRFTKFSPKSLFDDVLGNVRKSANTLEYISEILYPIKNGEFNQMKEALENSRNLTKDAVLSSSGEEVLIDDTGYTGRRKLSNGEYDPKQIKINGRNIVFTADAWETACTAIGELILANGDTAYGINAEVLLGDFIVGNNLRILNSEGSDMFVVTEQNISANLTTSILNLTDNKIQSAVYDLDSSLSTKITETAASITYDFNEQLDGVNGKVNTMQSYIRFEDGNIILGEAASAVKLVIENDKIGIYNGDSVITQWTIGEILSPKYLQIPIGGKLRLGDFEFQPRDSGSLDFTWVGG